MTTSIKNLSTTPRRLRHLLLVSLGQELTGKRIREARLKAKLSQQSLAEKVGLQQGQSISNYERSKTAVDTERLRLIAEATSQPLSFFLGEPEPEPDAVRLAVREEMAETKEIVARIAAHLGLDGFRSAGEGH